MVADNALAAADYMNEHVLASDDFKRKTPEMKSFLQAAPTPLKRKPAMQESITFYRPGDVIAIQLTGKFYAACIHEFVSVNDTIVIELYDHVSEQPPALAAVLKCRAEGRAYPGKRNRW